jgi:hypothetical protein
MKEKASPSIIPIQKQKAKKHPTVEEHPSAETRSRSRPAPWNLTHDPTKQCAPANHTPPNPLPN